MTDARVEPVPADPASARIFLDQAESFLADADQASIGQQSKQILYWQACISTRSVQGACRPQGRERRRQEAPADRAA